MNVRIQINLDDVQRALRGLDLALKTEIPKFATNIGQVAVQTLKAFEQRQGHNLLAELWDQTEPAPFPGGGVEVEVFSHAEEMTFYNLTTRAALGRVRSSKYPVAGKSLLEILEGGAKPHPISAVNAERLAIPAKGQDQALSEFLASHGKWTGKGKEWHRPGAGHTLPSTAEGARFPKMVGHPGVKGNAHVETTAHLMELLLDDEAEGIAARISEVL